MIPAMREPRKPPAPWLFSLLILPLGIVIHVFGGHRVDRERNGSRAK
jgi:hypothetical protein